MSVLPDARALKPCPFCGTNPLLEDGENDRPWVVQCINRDCPAQPFMDHADTKRQAIEAWNQRATPPASDATDVLPDARASLEQQAHEWRKREVQAIGAAISNRSWHAVEQAYNSLRDKMDRAGCWHAPKVSTPASDVGEVFDLDGLKKLWRTGVETGRILQRADIEPYSEEDEALYTRWLADDETLPTLSRDQYLRFQARIDRETKDRGGDVT